MTSLAPLAADPTVGYRATKGEVSLVEVPELLFASVDGHGAPGGAEFKCALGALYPIAYGVRFALRERGIDERVAPLEALWWTETPLVDFKGALERGGYAPADMDRWFWRAMLRLPRATDKVTLDSVRTAAIRRRPDSASTLESVAIGPWQEGLCVQTLHVGPYSAELPTVQLLHSFIASHGYRAVGRHHEIYLGDPRRAAPERLRTILRQPVELAAAGY